VSALGPTRAKPPLPSSLDAVVVTSPPRRRLSAATYQPTCVAADGRHLPPNANHWPNSEDRRAVGENPPTDCLASPLCNFTIGFGRACLPAGRDAGGVNGLASQRYWRQGLPRSIRPAGRHGCLKLTLHASDAYLGAPGFGVHRVTQFAQEACDGLFGGGWWPENFSLPMGFGYVLGWTRPVTIEEVADIAARQLKKHMRTTYPCERCTCTGKPRTDLPRRASGLSWPPHGCLLPPVAAALSGAERESYSQITRIHARAVEPRRRTA